MFSRMLITESTESSSDSIKRLKSEIETADAILIGAGAGLSASAGFDYSGERFERYFSDFSKKYGIKDMYSGGFYPFKTPEEYWAWWSRQIYINRYDCAVGEPYLSLLSLVKNKDYFVITTNVDHQFQRAGFDKNRLFYTQGDYGLWQCSKACHKKTYDNKEAVSEMIKQQKDMKIPAELKPKCPVCGKPMIMNLRIDEAFVQDKGWYMAAQRYEDFVKSRKNLHILYLELGVGMNTPMIIKYPFWNMTAQNEKAVYACLNINESFCPKEISGQSICIKGDIGQIFRLVESC